jgi:creatinine amidohydrolase/Fe(II)-dependent formamide hydrolase-like protein
VPLAHGRNGMPLTRALRRAARGLLFCGLCGALPGPPFGGLAAAQIQTAAQTQAPAQAQTPAQTQAPAAQPASPPRAGSSGASPDPNTPRFLPAHDSVFLEELTWLEVRDAMRAGTRTVIIATGGIEMNGPYLALGKHNYVLRATTEAIARKLGHALVAPIVPFVPEGDIDPPTGHMRYPGSISLTADSYKRLLTDIAASLRTGGFEHIILIGDSGGNQTGMKEVAADLSAKWAGGKTTIHFIPEYYDLWAVTHWLESQGLKEVDEQLHDELAIEAVMATVDPELIRAKERIATGKFSINGVNLAPLEKTIALGKRIADYRAELTVAAIKKAIGR